MFFRQYNLACLSIFSYLIGDTTTGRAVVVDPQRDIDGYLDDAQQQGLTIERVIETHFHADFLSGHLELAEATGAVISYGETAETDFPIEILTDGQRLSLGSINLEILHTPGHTPESISIVVRETTDGEPWAVLTGDALFIGDVGRPDLLSSNGWSADDLAAKLYDSLRTKLMTLPPATLVYPAHGAGSACGKNMSSAVSSTIGEQIATNYALADMPKERFIALVTAGQSPAPGYFPFAADANRRQRDLLDEDVPPPTISLDDALDAARHGAILIDTRAPETFASGHLRGAVNVGLDGRFAEYAGSVIRPRQDVVVMGEPGTALETKVRLSRIGIDSVMGELADLETELATHPDHATAALRLPAAELALHLDDAQIIDVRGPGEVADSGTVPGALSLPLATLPDHLGELDATRTTIVYCAGGYRSSIAASLLRANGFASVADLLGGFGAWTTYVENTPAQ